MHRPGTPQENARVQALKRPASGPLLAEVAVVRQPQAPDPRPPRCGLRALEYGLSSPGAGAQRSGGLKGYGEALSSSLGIQDTPIRRIDEDDQRLGVVLLRDIGEATGDDRALALAIFLTGKPRYDGRGTSRRPLQRLRASGPAFHRPPRIRPGRPLASTTWARSTPSKGSISRALELPPGSPDHLRVEALGATIRSSPPARGTSARSSPGRRTIPRPRNAFGRPSGHPVEGLGEQRPWSPPP